MILAESEKAELEEEKAEFVRFRTSTLTQLEAVRKVLEVGYDKKQT